MERSAIRDSPLARWSRIALRSIRATIKSIRPHHFEHVFRPDLEIVALAPGTHDRVRQPGLVDAIPDHGLVDMDGHDLAQREPGLRLLAVGALQLNDLRQLAFERDRAFGDPGHIDELALARGEPRDRKFADVARD